MFFTALEKERFVGSHLRVRRWAHRGADSLIAHTAVHSALELAWVESGEIIYRIGRRMLRVRSGELMVVPPGVEHATTFSPGCHAGSLWFGGQRLVDEAGFSCADLSLGAAPPALGLEHLAKHLQAEAFAADSQGEMAADLLAEALLLRLSRVHPRQVHLRHSVGIRRALELMNAHFAEALSVEQLAQAAAMSRYYFSRCFRKEVGESPYARLQRIRLNRAAVMLRHGRVSVTEASLACGFGDLGRFSRKFRQQFGCTPSQMSAREAQPAVAFD
ncbi:MAG: AraC family transcriptional regulator [Myxococcaceae bacterium]|nr:AraC family transcriptional regulator [Myxococcaceae bacterium]